MKPTRTPPAGPRARHLASSPLQLLAWALVSLALVGLAACSRGGSDEEYDDHESYQSQDDGMQGEGPGPDTGGPEGDGPPDPATTFDRLDANDDGRLFLDEIPTEHREHLTPLFRHAGKESAGMTRDEFVAAVSSTHPGGGGGPHGGGPGGGGPGDGGPGGGGPGGGGPGGAENDPHAMFAALDRNKNGRVELDEFPKDQRKNFEQMMQALGKPLDQGLSEWEFVDATSGDGPVAADDPRMGEGRGPAGPGGRGGPPAGGGPPGAPRNDDSESRKLFDRLDRDGSGGLRVDEMPGQLRQQGEPFLERGGRKGGEMTYEEFQQFVK